MRTHGISQAQAYKNLRRFVRAVNDCPQLAITYDSSLVECVRKVVDIVVSNPSFKTDVSRQNAGKMGC